MAKETKPITWQQLKDFANALPKHQLRKGVQWWGEERSGKITRAYRLKEDHCQTDDGIETACSQEYEEGDEPPPITHPKGTPMLDVD